MRKLIQSLSFLSGNFLYQYIQDIPDYFIAGERSFFMGSAMLFIVYYDDLMIKILGNK